MGLVLWTSENVWHWGGQHTKYSTSKYNVISFRKHYTTFRFRFRIFRVLCIALALPLVVETLTWHMQLRSGRTICSTSFMTSKRSLPNQKQSWGKLFLGELRYVAQTKCNKQVCNWKVRFLMPALHDSEWFWYIDTSFSSVFCLSILPKISCLFLR